MPQDPNLYGQPPPKKQKKSTALPSSLAFTSQLSSLLAAETSKSSSSSTKPSASSTAIPARARPSKSRTDDLFNVKVKRKSQPKHSPSEDNTKLTLKDTPNYDGPTESERALARRKMESKARLYAAMKRGDFVGRESEMGLVDFDRKWAEMKDSPNPDGAETSSGDDSSEEDDNIDRELVEWEDEFGRMRRGTKAEKLRFERNLARGAAATAELETMSARPKEPEQLIIGDAVQTEAFAAKDEAAMEELARKRDRSATPPPLTHYRADHEIRTKGVGFYAFSQDEETRQKEMASLEAERAKTEASRKEREDKLAARKRQIEERKREVEKRREELGQKRAKKKADSFLDGLMSEMGAPAGGETDESKS
ncbi:hypothetical protein QBC34DRAFT_394096 [Podospora aff. communis PSN243]|uniref:Uncharacterized protein n=1 Tax=Podospora aff. communis PSN243 TaxID=3040156 RepID=A0AAV9H132_9PEZI|nr:hypothetical protein QBC34DRAFT_394096 [Podospora aff. communis PSN243]